MTAPFRITSEHIVGEVFDGEAIIIDTVTGAYFSLPDGPAEVWSALAGGASTLEAIAAASGLGPDEVGPVLAELVAAELVVAADPAGLPAPSSPPVLAKYSDMEELLLLDPIHDVAPTGWPAPGEPAASPAEAEGPPAQP